MSRLIPIIFALSAIVIPNTIAAHESTAPKKPNILLILADDMGYSDLGCFGGEFHTPNLDRLAKNGLRYTQFYNTARCWPSRAAILTGYYAQQVRRDTIPGVLQNGMAGIRPTWAKLLPERLKPLGYRTYHSGKWHVDGTPLKNGFDRSYWVEDQDRHFNPKDLYRDDVKLPPVPRGTTYYDATAIADSAVEFLSDHASQHADQPFFEYLAFTTPHFPLMAPAEDIAKYSGRFHAGWDQLRKERLARMKKIGILNCDLSDRTPGVPAWDTLSTAEQDAWERRIEVHAAMVDRIDQEVGRVLDQLKKTRDLDNTLIFFLSDNGASAEKLVRGDGNDPNAAPGSAGSFLCLEPAGANLCNAPLKRSKIFTHEGGISTSLIVHWPARIKSKGQFRRTPSHLIDLAPTILEIAGAA
ncbi:MAG: arylsulfatase, partial [Chthonomonadales bacterium]